LKKHAIVTDALRPAKAAIPKRPQPLVGARFVLGVASEAQLPSEGAREIAFAGRSNAGKSSAINALANHGRLAFASRTPGRTQQINLFSLRSGALVRVLPRHPTYELGIHAVLASGRGAPAGRAGAAASAPHSSAGTQWLRK